MMLYHLRRCLEEARKAESLIAYGASAGEETEMDPLTLSNWVEVVEIIRMALWEGRLV